MKTPVSPNELAPNRKATLYTESDWYWIDIEPPLTIEEIRDLPRFDDAPVEHAPYIVMQSDPDKLGNPKTTIAYSCEVIDSDDKLEMLIGHVVHSLGTVAVEFS